MPACSSSPIPAVAHRLAVPAALAPDQCRDLLDYLAQVADPITGLADGMRWARCWPSRSPRCWPSRGPWPRSANGPLTRPSPSWLRSGCAATRCAGSTGHPTRPLCAACWPASIPTRWTWSSAGGWPTSSNPHPSRRGGGRSRSTARPCAAAATKPGPKSTCSPRWTTPPTRSLPRPTSTTPPTRSPGSGRCWTAWTSPPPWSPPTRSTPNASTPTGWSPSSTPPTCSSSSTTSPRCTSSSRPCRGQTSPSPTAPATAGTAGSRPAASRSPTVAGLGFPHATQAIRITRRVRSLHSRRWRTVTVYAVTSLTAAQASPARLAD